LRFPQFEGIAEFTDLNIILTSLPLDMETIAVIDLGTNTFHLLIVELNERNEFTIKEKFREPVKLGEGGINSGEIAPQAFKRGIKALINLKKLIDSRQAGKVFAFATSAIRGASNAAAFIEEAKSQAGIEIRTINGNEEAALIFQGVKNAVQLPHGEAVLMVDIGGGSVEFIVARDGHIRLLRSLNLGAARLWDKISPSDPIQPEEIEACRSLILDQAAGLIQELKEFDISLLVGSSGTFDTLATMIAYQNKDIHSIDHINGYRFDEQQFESVFKKLTTLTKTERSVLPGMDSSRVDLIVVGSVIVDVLFQQLNLKQVALSSYALKEGILYDYIDTRRFEALGPGSTDRNLRERSVRNLGARFQFDESHADQTALLALSIFDQMESILGYGEEEREMLKYASMLHDLGHFLNRSGHHKHGQYLVLNSGMPGFSTDELLVISNTVRYHRKSFPTRDHLHFALLHPLHKTMVRQLAGILRIADNLDRGHRQLIERLEVQLRGNQIDLIVQASESVEIEILSAMSVKELFEQVFDRKLTIYQSKEVS